MVEPLKKRYCQGTRCASLMNRTAKAPKDQNIPAIKTIKIAEFTLSFSILISFFLEVLMNDPEATLLFLQYSVLFSILEIGVLLLQGYIYKF